LWNAHSSSSNPTPCSAGLTGEILRRFERGLRIAGMKFMQISRLLAEAL
jgi:nucleoside diphosphate kinase